MTPRQARLAAGIGQWFLRAILVTLRFRIDDRAGLLRQPPRRAVVWAFWHNRLFVVPYLFQHFVRTRSGAALTSASKDGEVLAAVLERFGIQPIRGSSSRRGVPAWREMKRTIEAGIDVAVTPDGPRGPRYHINPGLLLLAQRTDAPIMPVRVTYSSFFQLKSWDGFMIPKPFSRVDVIFDDPIDFNASANAHGFETERSRLEQILREGVSNVAASTLSELKK
ncbi:MAG: lysophospholipid acyltransferase family protein [Chthoniobacteraceae bacterium]